MSKPLFKTDVDLEGQDDNTSFVDADFFKKQSEIPDDIPDEELPRMFPLTEEQKAELEKNKGKDPEQEEEEQEEEEQEGVEEEEEEEEEEEQASDTTPELIMYNFLTDNAYVDAPEDFKGTTEEVRKLMEEVPQNLLLNAFDQLHPDSRNLTRYLFEMGESGSMDALQKYFDNFMRPQLAIPEITSAEVARSYLATKMIASGIVDDHTKAAEAIDLMGDDEVQIAKAKMLAEKDKEQYDKAAALENQRIQAIKQARQDERDAMFASVHKELDKQPWESARKEKVSHVLDPKVTSAIQQKVLKSPKAVLTLANLYSYWNEEEQDFDVKEWVLRTAESLKSEGKLKDLEKDSFSSGLAKLGQGSDTSKKKKKKPKGTFFPTIAPGQF